MRIKQANSFLLLTVLFSISLVGYGQTSQPAKQISIDEVIRRFAASESENKAARLNYTFTQDFDLMTIGEAGSITGRYHRISDIVLDDRGNRVEKITFFPPSTLVYLSISKEDLHDLAEVQPFGMTTETLPKYQVTYLRKEKIDELNTYVFDVKPKQLVKGERYLEGRIWVDDQDLQIVKVAGKSVPEVGEQKFPRFESYRENIDGKYWFPTYIYVDDVLDFKRGSVHMRMTVKFKNYKKFSTGIRVTDDPGEVENEEGANTDDKNKKPETKKPDAQPTTGNKKPDAKPETKKPETPPVTKKPPVE
jgi:hypothetical protein